MKSVKFCLSWANSMPSVSSTVSCLLLLLCRRNWTIMAVL